MVEEGKPEALKVAKRAEDRAKELSRKQEGFRRWMQGEESDEVRQWREGGKSPALKELDAEKGALDG